MHEAILVINSGSSSIKFAVYLLTETREITGAAWRGEISGIGLKANFKVDGAGDVAPSPAHDHAVVAADHKAALELLLQWLAERGDELQLKAAGHRVVHGGRDYSTPVLIDSELESRLARLIPLAPLHQPHNLAGIQALRLLQPDLPQVACFDTAFHHTLAPPARSFALPRELTQAGVIRYGFHGLSYEYIASVLPDYLEQGADGRVVVAHLGHGASLCALENRKSIATTMGFTPLDGLTMATRCGALDPGVILYLMREKGMDVDAIDRLLNQQSGLLGISGISGDMRELLASDAPHARQAIDHFVYRVGGALGEMAAALGGLDALVFTAGIGDHAPAIREAICRRAAWLGIKLDDTKNQTAGPRISAQDSRVSVWVIPTDEELMIARHALRYIER